MSLSMDLQLIPKDISAMIATQRLPYDDLKKITISLL